MPTGWFTTVRQVSAPYLQDADSATGLNNWLINAFNGEWLRTEDAVPVESIGATSQRR